MEETIIALAKAAILVALNQPEEFNLTHARNSFPMLNSHRAAFVTLRTLPNYELRGCIGSLTAYRPLYKEIIFNAQAAAMKDSRFSPLKKEELSNIKLEVALLSEPTDINYSSVVDLQKKIRPLEDGVVLKLGKHRATYLPSVWEVLPKFDQFFNALCLKAGLNQKCLDQHPTLSTYQVTKYKEK